jgi:iron complex transport system permease protein
LHLLNKKIKLARYAIILLAPIIITFITLFLGRYPVSFSGVIATLFYNTGFFEKPTPEVATIIFQLRLPRAIAGAFIGAALAISGAAFQGVFRNPLVSSGILGVSNGAGFGAALAIVFLGGSYYSYILAFLFQIHLYTYRF